MINSCVNLITTITFLVIYEAECGARNDHFLRMFKAITYLTQRPENVCVPVHFARHRSLLASFCFLSSSLSNFLYVWLPWHHQYQPWKILFCRWAVRINFSMIHIHNTTVYIKILLYCILQSTYVRVRSLVSVSQFITCHSACFEEKIPHTAIIWGSYVSRPLTHDMIDWI